VNDSPRWFIRHVNSAMETWQPAAQGLDVTLYNFNQLPWQQFEVNLADGGGLRLVSAYTDRTLAPMAAEAGALIQTEPPIDDTLQEWLVAGVAQAFGPTARDDAFTTTVDTIVEGRVNTNDDANGFDILALPITQPENGQLVGLGGSIYGGITPWGAFTYQPNPGFVGEDRFVYLVLSSFNGAPSRFATVRVTVTP